MGCCGTIVPFPFPGGGSGGGGAFYNDFEEISRGARHVIVVRDDEPNVIVPMHGDDSGNDLVSTSISGQSPGYTAVGASGRPALTFSGVGGQGMFGEFANDWGYLHQPPLAGAAYLRVQAGLNSQVVFRTKTAAATGGILLLWDGGALRFWLVVYDAAGGFLVSLQGAPGSTAAGVHQVTWRITSPNAALGPRAAAPFAQLFVDGVQVASQAAIGAGAISTLAPLAPKTWGIAFAGTNAWTGGELYWNVDWSHYINDAQVAQLYADRDAIRSRRWIWSPWEMGDSITVNASAYPRWLDVRTRRTPDVFKLAAGTQPAGYNFPAYDMTCDGIVGQTLQNMLARVNAPLNRVPNVALLLGGTNNLGGSPPLGPIIALSDDLILQMMSRFGIPGYRFTIPRGDGTIVGYNTTVDNFNALLRASVYGTGILDFYNPPTTSVRYAYDNATWAADGVGHPTPIGGVGEGNNGAAQVRFRGTYIGGD